MKYDYYFYKMLFSDVFVAYDEWWKYGNNWQHFGAAKSHILTPGMTCGVDTSFRILHDYTFKESLYSIYPYLTHSNKTSHTTVMMR